MCDTEGVVSNVYFDLTRACNAAGPAAALASGQAVVHYRVAITSKDGSRIGSNASIGPALRRMPTQPRRI